jgi:high affinity Mn2+ porin
MGKARMNRATGAFACAMTAAALLSAPVRAFADSAPDASADTPASLGIDQAWAVHGQTTLVEQANDAFRSPYRGANSLSPDANGRETFDATLFLGVRLWPGAELWVNQEIDQGFGLSNTLGAAGFPSGEAYKVGKSAPYLRLQRAFVRQTINLGGDKSDVDAAANQLSGAQTANRIVITAGKFGVGDVFDTNKSAHDPRADFLNWSVIDTGTFDYAADAWGYSAGAAVEWYQGRWTIRAGLFDLSDVPNSTTLDGRLGQFQGDLEVEERHQLWGQPGKIAVTGFINRGRMGSYADALALAAATHTVASTAAVRDYRSRTGLSVNLEQQLTADLGLFARAGFADGDVEPYEFADIDDTVAVGLSLAGTRWGRKDDTVGLAGVVNTISKMHQAYLAAGGLGILVGDGRLPHPGAEQIAEAYYSAAVTKAIHISLDGQVIGNPAYNRDRGPVGIMAVRLHGEF